MKDKRMSTVNLNLADAERRIITAALIKHEGRRSAMAEELGISERTLYRKLHEHQLHAYYERISG